MFAGDSRGAGARGFPGAACEARLERPRKAGFVPASGTAASGRKVASVAEGKPPASQGPRR